MANEATPCGIKTGDIIKPGNLQQIHKCHAVTLLVQPGSGELGLPSDQRTLQVYAIGEADCHRLRTEGEGEWTECVHLQGQAVEATMAVSEFVEVGFTREDIIREIGKHEHAYVRHEALGRLNSILPRRSPAIIS
jgi:hypothetical protein